MSGDAKGRIKGLGRAFKIESKVGYGGAKQLTVKKEWLDKIAEESLSDYSLPLLACRFSGSRRGVENFIVMDLDVFIYLMNCITELGEIIDGLIPVD